IAPARPPSAATCGGTVAGIREAVNAGRRPPPSGAVSRGLAADIRLGGIVGCVLFPEHMLVQESVEFLRGRIAGLSEIVIQATVVAVALAKGRDRDLGPLQDGLETPRLGPSLGIAG